MASPELRRRKVRDLEGNFSIFDDWEPLFLFFLIYPKKRPLKGGTCFPERFPMSSRREQAHLEFDLNLRTGGGPGRRPTAREPNGSSPFRCDEGRRERENPPSPRTANKLEGKWKVSLCLVAPPQAAAGNSTNSSFRWHGPLLETIREAVWKLWSK